MFYKRFVFNLNCMFGVFTQSQLITYVSSLNNVSGGSYVRPYYDGIDLKLFILVGDGTFFVACQNWFCFIFSVLLFCLIGITSYSAVCLICLIHRDVCCDGLLCI